MFDGARMIAGLSEPMERGHQERLAPMAAQVMAGAGVGFAALGRIAVTNGPGSFTGLRVGLAFAKGLRLATDAPLVAIGALAALAASAGPSGRCAGVIDARRGMVYLQAFEDGRPLCEAELLAASDAARRLAGLAPGRWRAAGPGAGLLAGDVEALELTAPSLPALGALAARTPFTGDVRPVYLRAPDAAPQKSPRP